jgi:hypothetical protein
MSVKKMTAFKAMPHFYFVQAIKDLDKEQYKKFL